MPARRRHVVLTLVLALGLIAAFPLARLAVRRAAGVPPPPATLDATASGLQMPSVANLVAWVGTRPMLPRGTPVALVVFSATDPGAAALLAEAEAWHDAYSSAGVRVVGLHRPRFAFAADTAWLARQLQRLGVSFPVASDAALEVALPAAAAGPAALVGEVDGAAVLAAGAAGRAAADRWLRARAAGRPDPLPRDAAAAPAEGARLVRLAAGAVTEGPLADAVTGVAATFVTQTRLEEEGPHGVPVPVGRWTPRGDGLEAARGGPANFVAFRYDAARLGVIASPPPGRSAKLWVLRDESWVPPDQRGPDLEADAHGATFLTLDQPRLLLAIAGDRGDHVVRLSPDSDGVLIHGVTLDTPR